MVRRARGMTLVEVMVALGVAVVGLLGALATLGTLLGGTTFSRNATEASVLAQSRLEELQSLAGITVAPPNPPDGPTPKVQLNAKGQPDTGPNGVYFRREVWSTQADATGGRRLILVEVEWRDALGPHFIRLQGARLP